MDQQTFEDPAAESLSSVLFEAGASSVMFEAGAMDDSFDAGTSEDPFAESAATPVDIYTDDSEASTIEVVYSRPAGAGLPRSFASSMLERCDDMLERCDDMDDCGSLLPGFRRDEGTSLTTKLDVVDQDSVQQSEFFVSPQSIKQEFPAVQVEGSINWLIG